MSMVNTVLVLRFRDYENTHPSQNPAPSPWRLESGNPAGISKSRLGRLFHGPLCFAVAGGRSFGTSSPEPPLTRTHNTVHLYPRRFLSPPVR